MHRPLPHRRPTALLAVLALLLAQAIGLAHGIAHPHSRGGLPVAQAVADGTPAYASHEEGSAQCRVLDQLTHADALASAAFDAPVVRPPVPRAVVVSAPAPTLVVWRCLARGPPSFLA